MRQFCHTLALFLAGGILGSCAFLSAATPSPRPLPPGERGRGEGADEGKVSEKPTPAKSEKEMKRLIDQLGSERFENREQATQELSKLGKSALPSLKEAIKSRDAEVRHRAQQLIERLSAVDTQRELAKLQGTWKVVSLVRDGVESTADELKQWTLLTIKGSDYYWGENQQGAGGTIVSIDPSTNPKTIKYQGNEGTVYLGIYEIDGDTFKDCLISSNERPKEFTAKLGSGRQLMIHKRVK